MRRVDLANSLLLTAGGVTRLLDGLERDGFVAREVCASDRRVSYAALTEAGRDKLREASKSHTRQIRELMGRRTTTTSWLSSSRCSIGCRTSTPRPAAATATPRP